MSVQILDPNLFAARINLWVEDDVTRVTLTEYWQDIDIRVSSAAGVTGVKHLTAASRLPPSSRRIVVGVIDRDFGTDNQAKWRRPDVPVLRLPVHELENLLLADEALAEVSRRDIADVTARAETTAAALDTWMACRKVITGICETLGASFPEHPPSQPGLSEQAALDSLTTLTFWETHSAAYAQLSASGALEAMFKDALASYRGDINSGTWRDTFAGKEILRSLRSQLGIDTALNLKGSPSQRDADLAKEVARRLRTNPALAQTARFRSILDELRAALRDRAGLT